MMRNILLSALAAAALAGCATGYAYRGGNGGDYYYGQPRTEYRYYDPYGYYGGFGGYAPGYYYDRFGRLVYGGAYGYYGYPYGGYGSWWYRPRPHHGQGGHGDRDDDDRGGDRNDRKPPWRDFGGLAPRRPRVAGDDGEDARPRRQTAPLEMPRQREPRMAAPPMPRMRSETGSGGSRMGRVIRGAKAASSASDE